MAKTDKGREYMALYYAHGAEISAMLEANKILKFKVAVAVLQSLPVAGRTLRGDAAVFMPPRLMNFMSRISREIGATASVQLKTDMARVLAELKDPAVLAQLGLKKPLK